MNLAYALPILALSVSCGASDAIRNLTTITLGANEISPITIDRSVMLPANHVPGCIDVSLTDPSTNASVQLAKSDSTCTLSINEPDMVLLDLNQVQRARQSAGPFDVNGVRSGSIELQMLQLQDANGNPIDLGRYVASITLELDGEVVLDHLQPSDLNLPLSRQLPAATLNEIKGAVKNNQVAKADVSFSLVLNTAGLSDLPSNFTVHVVMQPTLQVDVIDAAL